MPQGDYTELHRKRHGYRLDHFDRRRKKEARQVHRTSAFAQKVLGIKAKMFAKKRYREKALMKKTIAMDEESSARRKVDDKVTTDGAIPAYLLDRDTTMRAKVLSNSIKQKRKEKAGKWEVPLPKIRPVDEDEMFRVIRSGKRKNEYLGNAFGRCGELHAADRATSLRNRDQEIPIGPTYTSLGVVTKGTIIEVNVSELGLVTPGGKVVWDKKACSSCDHRVYITQTRLFLEGVK